MIKNVYIVKKISFMRSTLGLVCILILMSACPEKSKKGLIGDYRALSKLSIEANSATVYASKGVFSKNDIGKTLVIHRAGIGDDGAIGDELIAIIKTVPSSSRVVLRQKASNTVKNADGGIGTDNTVILRNAMHRVSPNGKTINFSRGGNFYFSEPLILKGVKDLIVNGNGATISFISTKVNSYISGRAPKRNVFNLFQCRNIHFKDFKVVNIGQKESRNDQSREGGYWGKRLNDKEVLYNRHFNKQANTGAFVQIQECENVELLNIETTCTGGLFRTIPGANIDANKGGYVKNCKVNGWGSVAVYPVHGMLVEGNIFDNSTAPALSSVDIHKKWGTSHVIYSTSGYSNIKVINNQIRYCRGTAIQFNTKVKDACIGNIIEGNTFIECARNGSFYGQSNPLEVTLRNNVYENCGRWEIDQASANILFEKEQVVGEPTGNQDFKGFLSFSRVGKLNIKKCEFKSVVKKGNVGVIQMSSHSGKSRGMITIEDNYFDDKNVRAFLHLLDHNDFSGKLHLKKNRFDAEVRFVGLYGAPKKVSGNGKDKFFIEDNTFGGSQSNQIVARFGVTLKGNKHLLKNKNYAIEMDLIEGAGESEINNCEFVNKGGTNSIKLGNSKANHNTVNLKGCTFKGLKLMKQNSNKLKATQNKFN